MAKGPNTTTAPTGQVAPFGLRMLPDLKERVEQAAKSAGRSMNAEIVARLQGSFEAGGLDALPEAIKSLVEQSAAERGISVQQAVVEGLLAGLDPGAKPVYYFHVHQDASINTLVDVLMIAQKHMDEDSAYYVQQDQPKPTKKRRKA